MSAQALHIQVRQTLCSAPTPERPADSHLFLPELSPMCFHSLPHVSEVRPPRWGSPEDSHQTAQIFGTESVSTTCKEGNSRQDLHLLLLEHL